MCLREVHSEKNVWIIHESKAANEKNPPKKCQNRIIGLLLVFTDYQ